jgi:hypothetical protein
LAHWLSALSVLCCLSFLTVKRNNQVYTQKRRSGLHTFRRFFVFESF